MTDSKRRSLVSTCAASMSVSWRRSRCAFSPRSRAVWIASPSSRATASASATSPGSQRVGSSRWRPKTPMIPSKTTMGVASVARVPRSRSACLSPRAGSAISRDVSASSTTTVRRSRAARLSAGSLGATSSTDSTPGAFHSARIGIGSPSSPSRMKQRETPTAFAVSSTATRRTVSRSSSERTRRPISAISRSRSTRRPQRLVRARPPEGERRLARQALHESRARHP